MITLALAAAGVGPAAPAAAAAPFANTAANAGDSWSAVPYFTCRNADLAASPYLFYPLNETGGTTAVDASGNARNGTYQGSGTTFAVTGPCARDNSKAITLNGSSGYLSTPTAVANPTVFTEEIWFKTSTTRGGRLIGFGSAQTGASGSDDRHLYLTNAGQVTFGVRSGTVKTIVSASAYNDGVWHLADATLSAAGMRLYLDGQLVASDATVTTPQNYSGWWRIGYDSLSGWTSAPTSNFVAATLADAAVYSTALTAAQIAGHYTAS